MKTCADYGELQLWAAMPGAIEVARAEHLAVVRFELVERGDFAAGWVDLTFACGERICVVPGLVLQLPLALRGDPTGIVWPRAAAAFIGESDADAVGTVVLEQFGRWLSGRAVPTETVTVLVACPAFEAARAAAEVGAAPLAAVLPRVAPWVYAARLAGSGAAVLESGDAALGAAVLRRFGMPAAGVLDARSAAWYGVASLECAGPPALVVRDRDGDDPAAATVVALREPATGGPWQAIGVVPPAPLNDALAFAVDARPVAGRFWVRAPRSAPAAALPARAVNVRRRPLVSLACVVRDDAELVRDADCDELDALAAIARDAGVTLQRVPYAHLPALEPGVLPVALGDVRDPGFAAALEHLARRGGPYIAWLQPIGDYPDWHEAALYAVLREPPDDAGLAAAVRGYDLRALAVANVPAEEPPPAQTLRARIAAALAAASAIVLPATQSLVEVSQSYGGRGRPLLPIPPIVPPPNADDSASAGFGAAPFVLVHGAAEPRSAMLLAVLALRDAPIPAVVALDAADAAYAAVVRRAAGPRTTILENVPAATLTALYARAAMYVEPALRPRSLVRAVRAARSGALPVLFADAPLAPLLDPDTVVPRRGVADLRDTLTTLWNSPLRAHQARAAAHALGKLDRADVAVRDLFDAICDLTGA